LYHSKAYPSLIVFKRIWLVFGTIPRAAIRKDEGRSDARKKRVLAALRQRIMQNADRIFDLNDLALVLGLVATICTLSR
jgi:hypothetical protein